MALVAGRPLPMLALPVLLAAAGCAAAPGCAAPGPSPSLACGPGETEARELTAWFGLHSAARGRELSEVEWQEFRDRALTPRFPQGFTVVAGRGAWRHADGRIGQEATRIVTVLVPAPEAAAALARLRAAAADYAALHPQEAIGIAHRPACAGGLF